MAKSVIEKSSDMIGAINDKFDMRVKDMCEIYDTYGGNFETIGCAFRFGYLQGMKAAKAEQKRKEAKLLLHD